MKPITGAGGYTEDDLLPISALQHLLFCERQCALIHIERLWAENRLTVEGGHLHRRAHDAPTEVRGAVRITRGLPLRSLRLGLSGKADVVEFHPAKGSDPQSTATGRGSAPAGPTIPFPVEYKRGRPKRDESDRVQLCAQAICLEEMLEVAVPRGALFYGRTRRRFDVEFDDSLRRLTKESAHRLHELVARGLTPLAVREPKCDGCSLLQLCLPDATSAHKSASRYFDHSLDRILTTPTIED